MTLNARQTHWARLVVVAVKGYPRLSDVDHRRRAADIALATCLTESSLLMYANSNVPASLKIAHDAVGTDHDSVGLYQQRVPMWGTVHDCMDPYKSTAKFLNHLVYFDWTKMSNWAAAQKVQGSAFPTRYREFDQLAIATRKRLW